MTNSEYVSNLLEPYGPMLPLAALVEELNKLYHSFEASSYDAGHPEVHEQLPPIWTSMIELARQRKPRGKWRILDYGCGTGFEAMQVIRHVGPESIDQLTCYDPSVEMLNRCRQSLASAAAPVRFLSDFEQLVNSGATYDLMLTNSLLHHLPAPASVLSSILPLMSPDALWLAGHEPSKRYFRNPECSAALDEYNRRVFARKLLSPDAYWRRLRRIMGFDRSPASATAAASHQNGLFQRRPSPSVISRVVDYHVPHSPGEALAGRGFDFHELEIELKDNWRLEWVKSYAFLAHHLESELPADWQRRAQALATRYPLDGANFCTVWQRI